MPHGKGTYGSKVGRPSNKAKSAGMKAAMRTGVGAMKRKPTKRKTTMPKMKAKKPSMMGRGRKR